MMADVQSRNATCGISRREFLGAAAGSLAGGALALAAESSPPPPDPAAIKLLTCNIRLPLAEDDAAGNGWTARRAMCADIIIAQKPHLIALQEAREEQIDYLLERMPSWQAVGLGHPDLGWSRVNAILFAESRFTLKNSGGFWLSETPHIEGSSSWDSARPRFVNWAHLADNQTAGELRVWNAHFDHVGRIARQRAAELIVAATQSIPASLPQVLMGDFNAGARHPAIEAIKSAGWQDTYAAIHGPDDPGFTAHAFLGPARREKGHGRKIDWIFVRPGARTLAAEVIREGRNGRFPSDHYFVSATVVLPKL
jgi:endonuclease/exonuclease/phosphatase family metal-dependent hydrolase